MLKWAAKQCGAVVAEKKQKETELAIKEHTLSLTRRPSYTRTLSVSELYGVCEHDLVEAADLVMCLHSWRKKVYNLRAARTIIQQHFATHNRAACGEADAVSATPWRIARNALASRSSSSPPTPSDVVAAVVGVSRVDADKHEVEATAFNTVSVEQSHER